MDDLVRLIPSDSGRISGCFFTDEHNVQRFILLRYDILLEVDFVFECNRKLHIELWNRFVWFVWFQLFR